MFSSRASAAVAVRTEERVPNRYTKELIETFESRFGVSPASSGAVVAVGDASLVELFLEHRYSVRVVAQNDEVYDRCTRLLSNHREAEVLQGTPDATGLPSHSLDFITSSRALFWPNQAGVLKEFRRILRPGAPIALVTDNRVYSGGEQSEDYVELLRTHCPSFKEKAEPYDIAAAVASFFADGDVYEDAFIGHQELTVEDLIRQTSHLAIYPPDGDPGQPRIESALRKFFKRYSHEGTILVPRVCRFAFGHLGDL